MATGQRDEKQSLPPWPPPWTDDALGPWASPPSDDTVASDGTIASDGTVATALPADRYTIALAVAIAGLLVAGGVALGVHSHRHYAAAPPTPVTVPSTISPQTGAPSSDDACPSGSGPPTLPAALFSAAPYFTVSADPYQGRLDETQVTELGGAQDTTGNLDADDFLGAVRQSFTDASAATLVDVMVYDFGCILGTSNYYQALQSFDLGIVSPVAIDTGNESTEGWASAGPDASGEFRQAAVGTSGDYYVALYTYTAQPVNGQFTTELLNAELGFVNQWTGDPAAAPPGSVAAPAPVLLALRSGQAPVCPPASGTLTADQFDRLLPAAPAGYEQLPDESPAGPVTATQISDLAPIPALGAALTRAEGFSGGYRRYWADTADHDELEVQLIVFSCATAAEITAADEPAPGAGYTTFAVTDGIPDAAGAVTTTRDAEGHYQAAILAPVGPVDMTVAYFSATTDPSTVEALAASVDHQLQAAIAAGAATP